MKIRTILLIGIAYRVALFLGFMVWPISNEDGNPVSPLIVQDGVDFSFYFAFRDSVSALIGELAWPFEVAGQILPGPIVPLLLKLSDYQAGSTLILAVVFLGISIALVWISLTWLSRRGIAWPWLVVFALLPNPIWFTISISTDLPFALLVACVVFFYFRDRRTSGALFLVLGFALVAALVRPNGLLLLAFIAADQMLFARNTIAIIVAGIAAAACFVLVSYYWPYFTTYSFSSMRITYFDISQRDYLDGIYDTLPPILNKVLSIITLAFAKLIYFVGLRPSYGETAMIFVLMRGAAGLVLLPGLLAVFLRRDWSVMLFTFIMLMPYVGGAAQDRYYLSILVVLFWSGAQFYNDLLRRFGFAVSPKVS